ncbi:chloramphenicol-sensitive protein RarD [Salinihabitans flavidus]|uniref:Chloramphenicol-sensitive protein RarD n=1 Tax=Salinihabitans flavidus TaxID=569882 RepID=A0A1H8NL34_9RHOB|nr:EamA family transporter RarD [Salinihabitans flavidus]SEO30330.1 chloramphenicol-sensitive protein RarD [Salinihabitans flavidus]
MDQARAGVLAMVAACMIWGLSPLYYKLLAHLPPIEVLAHRTIWSAVLFTGVLALQGRLGLLRAALSDRRTVIVVAAALSISTNWFLFIWSIGSGHATEASMGYFLFPLVAVVIGRVTFGETLGPMQMVAVGLALTAVTILTWGLGVAPWIALSLAFSFGAYGLFKKRLDLGPVVSVTGEVWLLGPVGLLVLAVIHGQGGGGFGADWGDSGLLMLSGALTATPLILFSFAARRVRMATVGVVQYLNPTLQFLCATLIFAEPFGIWHGIAFPLIWVALAIYTYAGWRQDRAAARAASSVSTSAAT